MASYLIDGYNLMHALGIAGDKLPRRGLERARRRLLDFLAEAFGQQASQVRVVFDAAAAPKKLQRATTYRDLQVEFAVGQPSADDYIEAVLAAQNRPMKLMVVSNDARLQEAARRRGAEYLSSAAFLDHLEQLRRLRLGKPVTPLAAQTGCREEQMRRGETERWLREFAGLEDEPELKEALKPFDFEVEENG